MDTYIEKHFLENKKNTFFRKLGAHNICYKHCRINSKYELALAIAFLQFQFISDGLMDGNSCRTYVFSYMKMNRMVNNCH